MQALYLARRVGAKHKRKNLTGLDLERFHDRYTVSAYYKRVRSAARRAGVPHWFPYQLRHLAEVTVERAFTLDAARAVLRHRDAKTTTRYGIVDLQKAAEVAAKIG